MSNIICKLFGHKQAKASYSFSHTDPLGWKFYTLDPDSCARCGTWSI